MLFAQRRRLLATNDPHGNLGRTGDKISSIVVSKYISGNTFSWRLRTFFARLATHCALVLKYCQARTCKAFDSDGNGHKPRDKASVRGESDSAFMLKRAGLLNWSSDRERADLICNVDPYKTDISNLQWLAQRHTLWTCSDDDA